VIGAKVCLSAPSAEVFFATTKAFDDDSLFSSRENLNLIFFFDGEDESTVAPTR
jgi:hypothetical protein